MCDNKYHIHTYVYPYIYVLVYISTYDLKIRKIISPIIECLESSITQNSFI